MRLSELCIRRPVMTTLVMASLLLAGFFGYRQLPIAAIPAHRGADHHRDGAVSRRQSRHHGGFGCGAAGAAIRHHRRHRGDHLAQHAGRHADRARVRPQSQHRCRRARRAVGDLGGGVAPADRPAGPAGLPQGQSGRLAGHLPGPHLRYRAIAGDERVRRQGDEPEALHPAGRRADQHPGRPEARRAHPLRPRRAGHARHLGGGDPAGRDGAVVGSPDRQHPHRAAALHPGNQGRRALRGLFQAGGGGLAQRRARAPAGRCPGRRFRGGRGVEDRVQRPALDHRLHSAPARCQHGGRHRCRARHAAGIPPRCCRPPSSSAC